LNELTYFLLGIVLGSLVTASLSFPPVGRVMTRIAAVVFLGFGVGFLTWGGVLHTTGETPRPWPNDDWNLITSISEAFAWGGGLFVAGLITCMLSFVKGKKRLDGK